MRPQTGQNNLPRHYLTKEAELLRFQELDSCTRLKHQAKKVISSQSQKNN